MTGEHIYFETLQQDGAPRLALVLKGPFRAIDGRLKAFHDRIAVPLPYALRLQHQLGQGIRELLPAEDRLASLPRPAVQSVLHLYLEDEGRTLRRALQQPRDSA